MDRVAFYVPAKVNIHVTEFTYDVAVCNSCDHFESYTIIGASGNGPECNGEPPQYTDGITNVSKPDGRSFGGNDGVHLIFKEVQPL